jgi:hypothetical protein
MALGPIACCADARFVSFLRLNRDDGDCCQGNDLDFGGKTAVAHGFEALVKPCKKERTPAEQLSGRWPCRRRLDVGDTITLIKLISLSVQDTKEC